MRRKLLKDWLPETEPKSGRKDRKVTGFLISVSSRYPRKHPSKRVAAAGRYRQLIDAMRAAVSSSQPRVMTAALLVLNLNTVVESGGQIH